MATIPQYLSPLRYPGGKSSLAAFVGSLIERTHPRPDSYLEPFAGGAGVGLYLLAHEYVDRIILNDLDRGIAAFWRSVFFEPDRFIQRIMECDVSIEAWHYHHRRYCDLIGDQFELGFSTFFLNRTNRSGILTARPIGGLRQQGRWLIDARFNRTDLARRVRFLSRYRNRVDIRNQCALEILDTAEATDLPFIYADPPYLNKGDDLYLNRLEWDDHCLISQSLQNYPGPWMVTYDHDTRVIDDLYQGSVCAEFSLSHTAARQHVGQEFVVFSADLLVDNLGELGPHGASWIAG